MKEKKILCAGFTPQKLDWARTKPGSRNSIWVSHVSGRDLNN